MFPESNTVRRREGKEREGRREGRGRSGDKERKEGAGREQTGGGGMGGCAVSECVLPRVDRGLLQS